MAGIISNPPPPGRMMTSDGQVSNEFDSWLRSLNTKLTNAQTATDNEIAALQATTFTDVIPGFIPFVANQDYPLAIGFQFPVTSLIALVQCTSGSCTATFKKNGTPISALSVSTSRATDNTAVEFAAGDDLIMTLSSNLSCRNMAFAFYYTRPLLT